MASTPKPVRREIKKRTQQEQTKLLKNFEARDKLHEKSKHLPYVTGVKAYQAEKKTRLKNAKINVRKGVKDTVEADKFFKEMGFPVKRMGRK